MRVRKDDLVQVITGRDKGKQGRILRVVPETQRVVVEGVNRMKRHTKPTPRNRTGGIIEREQAIHVSNVMIVDPKTDRPTRVRSEVRNEEKVRVAVKSGTTVTSG
ncbi:MAG: 50S ribosomal protein L24 [Deltaproteobacteria bacterium]|nr:50S ribosomal protein L24 [Deltaproteobacteria bacterium]